MLLVLVSRFFLSQQGSLCGGQSSSSETQKRWDSVKLTCSTSHSSHMPVWNSVLQCCPGYGALIAPFLERYRAPARLSNSLLPGGSWQNALKRNSLEWARVWCTHQGFGKYGTEGRFLGMAFSRTPFWMYNEYQLWPVKRNVNTIILVAAAT